ncbi:phosphatidylglycerophosphatase [Plasticicumulans lactativorans]|uniref:Phosphatidylglycerophosphatase A n=1 Tax=Plasticicumulans lactativorans TaxID=1133106 RepID=A0A4R2L6Z1_9GAMM|nr:phosphatidylglycerophosphatase A [Plasticicumulans lactativorans]TCO82323.1 phosphatidylglycerophosphatase [Plasticicumulans lactativorans]
MSTSAERPARIPARLLRDPGHCLALGFGSGLAPVAPGTFGTLAGVPVYLLLAGLPLPAYLLATLLLAALGVWLTGRTARALGVHDHGGIVWDEIVGLLVTLTALPPAPWTLLAGFAAFRLFDVWKPWPIRVLDARVHGGLGIMADDLLAGVYAAAALHAGRALLG